MGISWAGFGPKNRVSLPLPRCLRTHIYEGAWAYAIEAVSPRLPISAHFAVSDAVFGAVRRTPMPRFRAPR